MCVTLNKREIRLLKQFMTHHGWRDLAITYPDLSESFKMSDEEIQEFKTKLGI